jgi:hypothetical protein
MSDDSNKRIDFFNASIDALGVTVSSAKDGHVFGFSRKYLQSMLDKNPNNEKFMIFVKHPTFRN